MTTKDFFCATLANEVELTLNAFRSIPANKTDYQPHPKARTAQQLVDHINAHILDLIEGVESTTLNHNLFLSYSNVDEACTDLQAKSTQLLQLLSGLDEGTWNNKVVPVFAAGFKLHDYTLRDLCFGWLSDVIHHRGQLSTYYRAMGTVPPNIYGPNAEQTEAMFAKVA